jgi:hypothetical protein
MNTLDVKAAASTAVKPSRLLLVVSLAIVAAFAGFPSRVQANVYATNIKLNGGFTNAVAGQGTNVIISYLLNEQATAGATVELRLGSTVIRTISLTNGAVGTLQGTNSVIWDVRNDVGQPAPGGTYIVTVKPSTSGYTNWTQISSDTNIANQIYEGRGIAVNKNTNSTYYGRIFVGNATDGPNADIDPLDRIGFHKINADATFAAEGATSDGGYDWSHGDFNQVESPWKLEIGNDDRLYANDFYILPGLVLSFDQIITSSSLRMVLTTNNWPDSFSRLSGMTVTGPSTNLQLWMADASVDGVGIRRWNIGSSGQVAANDVGVTVVQAGTGSDLDQFPEDMSVDSSNRIYVIQRREVSGDASPRLFRFPPYSGTPETVADWKIGSGDDNMLSAYGVAVNPSGSEVAVAVGNAVRVFDSSNGAPITSQTPELSPPHNHSDTAWDNVGNLYAIDAFDGIWRIYSPPGSNQASTVAVPQILVNAPPAPPLLGLPTYDGTSVHFTIYGEPNVSYIVQFSTDLLNWTSVLTNTSGFANRDIVSPAPFDRNFIRAKITP